MSKLETVGWALLIIALLAWVGTMVAIVWIAPLVVIKAGASVAMVGLVLGTICILADGNY